MEERTSMKMETASIKELVIIGLLGIGMIFVSLIIGATGKKKKKKLN